MWGCSLSSLISQNFLFLRIFVSLLVSAIGTLPHLCLWVQTSHYSFFLLYHYSPQACVPWHKCCLGYYLGVLQFDSSVSLHYLSQIKLLLCALLTVPTALSLTACQGLPPYSRNLCQVYIPSFYYQLSTLLLCFLCLLSINV